MKGSEGGDRASAAADELGRVVEALRGEAVAAAARPGPLQGTLRESIASVDGELPGVAHVFADLQRMRVLTGLHAASAEPGGGEEEAPAGSAAGPGGEAAPEAPQTVEAALDVYREGHGGTIPEHYPIHWRDFAEWCGGEGRTAWPADEDTVAAYVKARSRTLSHKYLQAALSAIGRVHEVCGLANPAGAGTEGRRRMRALRTR